MVLAKATAKKVQKGKAAMMKGKAGAAPKPAGKSVQARAAPLKQKVAAAKTPQKQKVGGAKSVSSPMPTAKRGRPSPKSDEGGNDADDDGESDTEELGPVTRGSKAVRSSKGSVKEDAPEKAKAVPNKTKFLESVLGDRKIADVIADKKYQLEKAEALLITVAAADTIRTARLDEARKELQDLGSEIKDLVAAEVGTVREHFQAQASLNEAVSNAAEAKLKLAKAQQRLMMLEMHSEQEHKMRDLEERRREASEAAEAARRKIVEYKARNKEAAKALQEVGRQAPEKKEVVPDSHLADADSRPAAAGCIPGDDSD